MSSKDAMLPKRTCLELLEFIRIKAFTHHHFSLKGALRRYKIFNTEYLKSKTAIETLPSPNTCLCLVSCCKCLYFKSSPRRTQRPPQGCYIITSAYRRSLWKRLKHTSDKFQPICTSTVVGNIHNHKQLTKNNS